MASKPCTTVDVCKAYNYAHVRFDDLDLDAKSQMVGKCQNKISVELLYLDD